MTTFLFFSICLYLYLESVNTSTVLLAKKTNNFTQTALCFLFFTLHSSLQIRFSQKQFTCQHPVVTFVNCATENWRQGQKKRRTFLFGFSYILGASQKCLQNPHNSNTLNTRNRWKCPTKGLVTWLTLLRKLFCAVYYPLGPPFGGFFNTVFFNG